MRGGDSHRHTIPSYVVQLLKEKLMTEPILKYSDFSKEFILLTDASKIALGAILSQKDSDGKEHPILYNSRTLNVHEKNYDITKLEALAIMWAIKKYRHYLHGRKFKIITDHNALVWLLNSNKPNTNGQIVRWRMILQDYDYEIVHRKGRIHQSVDAFENNINTSDNLENPIGIMNKQKYNIIYNYLEMSSYPKDYNDQ
jgi:hypothetical protein